MPSGARSLFHARVAYKPRRDRQPNWKSVCIVHCLVARYLTYMIVSHVFNKSRCCCVGWLVDRIYIHMQKCVGATPYSGTLAVHDILFIWTTHCTLYLCTMSWCWANLRDICCCVLSCVRIVYVRVWLDVCFCLFPCVALKYE